MELLGTWPGEIPGEADQTFSCYAAWRSANLAIPEWREKDGEINASPRMNDHEKLEAKRRLIAEMEDRMRSVLEILDKTANELDQEKKAHIRCVLAAESTSAATDVRAGEFRLWYYRLDEKERARVIHDAVNDGDRELLVALVSAPRAFRLLPVSVHDHVVQTLITRYQPEQGRTMKRKRAALLAARLVTNRVHGFFQRKIQFIESLTHGHSGQVLPGATVGRKKDSVASHGRSRMRRLDT
jgi:hypothetical protein